ncbi:imidazole glycerol phosphate synthase, glutamine amidotransferase subunit [Bernardetia litoralis DSM 6794]|uniref:Imidazole glycerol phosphate synthase subunit HisH n=1 Tax=Bernardetia litoralis (strain ATCC 23117 / DSM 6794 / NBRC 15988 / NCIMB 1366 / Fx l1 / Sio-4) TaxID=880071 RepID=I4AQD6_BERLS|nr:imidazole glycerol phosphate synthase subunit HisH [Bernardetia litoralis]AFM06171.1 imidazole glycerol phosphate synthase, glutamine amidotransferase subunit [Bernardetia litoralis DSM 6794]
MKIVIIDYKAGNIRSVDFALQRLGINAVVSADKDVLRSADKIIFPGVGHAESAMQHLKNADLDTFIPTLKQPVLGICLGMQLLCSHTEEGNTKGLGIFDVNVKEFKPINSVDKVPHMGWNTTENLKGELFDSDLFNKAKDSNQNQFYFVHTYYAELCKDTVASCDYILPFSAALQKDNFYAAQFHPEKSADAGEELLKNFLKL